MKQEKRMVRTYTLYMYMYIGLYWNRHVCLCSSVCLYISVQASGVTLTTHRLMTNVVTYLHVLYLAWYMYMYYNIGPGFTEDG